MQAEVPAHRVQKRVIHLLSQKIDQFLVTAVTPEMPVPSKDDVHHPCKKPLGQAMSLCSRLVSDYVFRFLRRAATALKQELQQQKYKSVNILCDASPKSRMDVWLPIISCGSMASPWVLQRLADLQVTTVGNTAKMDMVQQLCDTMAENMTVERKNAGKKLFLEPVSVLRSSNCLKCVSNQYCCSGKGVGAHDLRPRELARLKQTKLASREQLRALGHVMELLELPLEMPCKRLRPLDPQSEIRLKVGSTPYLWNKNTGQSTWDCLPNPCKEDHLRVTIQADEGGPLYCAQSFCAQHGLPMHLTRDELYLGRIFVSKLTYCMLRHARSHNLLDEGTSCPLVYGQSGRCMEKCRFEAHPEDMLQQVFQQSILEETLVCICLASLRFA
ncbi:unnamed protein product [Symbiodinium necroappetens]|uniref:Uncharacterized protein n=1 Tax=Symbiodinium necroappetens TaxID=1628268 RepID=A0A812R9S0_9DINO|nr:unnamed protein product [Symbiodinium necroappetens]